MRSPLTFFLKTFFFTIAAISLQLMGTQVASAAIRTWDGGGNDENWSNCVNWSGDVCPAGGDTATFDATSTKNGTIDTSFPGTVAVLNMNTGYTGIITQARVFSVATAFNLNAGTFQGDGNSVTATDLTIAGGTYVQSSGGLTVGANNCSTNNLAISSGTFTGGSGPISVTATCSAALSISGGAFTSTSGTLTAMEFNWTAGTVNPNNGTIELIGTNSPLGVPVGGGALFNLTINKSNGQVQTVTSGRALTVNGTLLLTNGRISADTAISVKGNVTYAATYDGITGSNVVFNVNGLGAQNIDYSNAVGAIEAFNVSNASATNTPIAGGVSITIEKLTTSAGTWNLGDGNSTLRQGLYISGGTVNHGSGALNIADDTCGTNRDFSITSGAFVGGSGPITWNGNCGGHTFDISGTGAFTSTTGTLTLDYDVTISGGSFSANGGTLVVDGPTANFDVNNNITLNIFTVAKNAGQTMNVGANDMIIVNGTLTLTDGVSNAGSIDSKSTVNMASTWDGGSTALLITGSGNSVVTLNSGNGAFPMTLNNLNANVNFAGVGTVAFSTANFQQGTLTAGSTTSTYSGAVTLSGATFNAPTSGGGTTHFNNSFNQSAGTFNGGTNVMNHGGTFTLSGGTYNASSNNTNASNTWTHNVGGTFNHSNGQVTANLNGHFTWDFAESETFYNFTLNAGGVSSWILTIPAPDTLIVANTLTLTNGAFSTGTLEARGNVSVASTFDGGASTANLKFQNSTVDQSLNFTTYTGWNLPITINKTSGAVNLASNITSSAGLTMQSGTVNPGNFTVTLGSPYNQSGGTWSQGSNLFDLNSNFTLSGGTFNATSNTMSVAGAWTHNVGGTFNHNNGNFVADLTDHRTWDFMGSETFNTFTLNGTSNWIMTVTSGETLVVTNTLTLTNGGFASGTVEARANVSAGVGFDAGGNASFKFQNSTADQNFDLTGYAGWNTPLTINKASGTVVLSSNFTTAGTVTMQSGSFNPGTFAVTINAAFSQTGGTWMTGSNIFDLNNTFNLSGGTFNATSNTMSVNDTWTHTLGGTFNHNNGTLLADLTNHRTWDFTNTETFNNFTLNGTSNWILTITSGDTLSTLGTLTLTQGGFSTGKLDAQGSVTMDLGFDSGSSPLTFSGSNVQNFTILSGATSLFDGDITVDKTGGQVTLLTSALTLNAANQDLLVKAGTLDLSGQSLTVNGTGGTLIVQNGAVLQLQGAESVTTNGGNPQFQAGSTVRYNGAAGPYTLKAYAYQNLEIAGNAASVFLMPGFLNIGANLTLTSGVLSLNGQNLTVTGAFNSLATLRLQGPETVTLTPDIDSGTVEYVGNANGTGQNFTIKNWTYYNVTINMTDAADTTDASNPLNISGNFKLNAGEFKAPSTTNLTGDFLHAGGIFTHNNGTLVMNGTNQSITGTSTFNNFTKSVASTATLTLPDGATQIFAGTLTLNGASGQRLNLRSSTPGVQASIDPQSARALSFLDIQDSNNLNVSAALCTTGCNNSLNNTNWSFIIPAVVPSSISGNTTEAGQTATFTVVLSSQPTNDVIVGISSSDTTEGTVSTGSLTFTNLNWNTPQTVTVTGVDDLVDDGDIAYTVITAAATSSDVNYNGINATDVSVNNVDNDTTGITVGTLSGNTTEAGATGTFTVVLISQPTADVSVGVSSTDTTEGTVSTGSLTFTSVNWSTPQTVTVTGVDDFLDDGDIAYSLVTAAASSIDGTYNGFNASDVSAVNVDNDTAGASLSESAVDVTEGSGNDTYTVVLMSQPTADITLTVTAGGQSSASPSPLTFTSVNWSTPQTVTVVATNDAYSEGAHSSTVTHTASSADLSYHLISIASITVNITDNDTAGVFMGAISGNTSEDGGTASFSVLLTSQPTANISFTLESSDLSEGSVLPTSLTFTNGNWNTPQLVTVTGIDDEQDDGSTVFSIVTGLISSADLTYNGLNPADVSVTNSDNDTAAVLLTQSAGSTLVTEGGVTDSYTLVLTSQPTGTVNIGIGTDGQVLTSTPTLAFTLETWNTPQTVTVTSANDDIAEGTHVSVILHTASSSDGTYNGITVSSVSASITDNDTAGITVSAISGNTSEAGVTATATLVLNSEPTSNVTIGIASSDTTEGTVLPTFVVFTSGNWDTPQTLTVTGVNDNGDDEAVAYSITTALASSSDLNYNNLNPSDIAVINDDNDTSGLAVSVISTNTTEAGGTATFTVVLLTQPTADVTIGVSSSDTTEGTVSPASLTFTSESWSLVQTVTVTGVNDLVVDGNISFNILTAAITSADLSYNGVNPNDVSVSNSDNDTAGVSFSSTSLSGTEGQIKEYTVVLNTEPTSNVIINIATDGHSTRSPATLTFTSGDWNVPQVVSITLTDDSAVEAGEMSTLTHSSFSLDSVYTGMNLSSVSVTITDNDIAPVEETNSGGSPTPAAGGGNGGGNGSSSSGDSSSNGSSSSSSSDDSSTSTETAQDVAAQLDEETPNHWSEGYLKNLIDESYIIDIAVEVDSFFEVLFDFFVAPDSGTNRVNALSFLLVQSGVNLGTITVNSERPSFTDVSLDDEDFALIEFAAKANLIKGYADGSFQPERVINRAEALKMAFSFYNQEVPLELHGQELLDYYELSENPFSDVDLELWYAPYIITAYHHGIVQGYPDGTFQAAKEVSHAEFLKIATLVQVIDLSVELASELE